VPVAGANHFSVLDRVGKALAPKLVAGSMGEVELLREQDFTGELPAR
jgi:hypothetical protein